MNLPKGVTLRRIPAGHPGEGAPVLRVHYTANPNMTPEVVDRERKKYSNPDMWLKEMEIEYEALEGARQYPEYHPERNVCDAHDVSNPQEWTIVMGADPHGRTPHCFVWVALGQPWALADPKEKRKGFTRGFGEARVCGELWPSRQYLVREYVDTIRWIESDATDKPRAFDWCQGKKLRVRWRVMDTHGKAVNSDEGVDYFLTYQRHKLTFRTAQKSELGAVRDAIGELLVPGTVIQGDTRLSEPRLKVFRACTETQQEFENVRYPQGEVEREGQEKPQTYRKHALDGLAYVVAECPSYLQPASEQQDEWEPVQAGTGY